MNDLFIKELSLNDENDFIFAMKNSQDLHYPWVRSPTNREEFLEYFNKFQHPNQKSFLLLDLDKIIIGVFNVSEIVRGLFQNAYLGFYGVKEHSNKGKMSAGLKIVLNKIFTEIKLHRVEANIQPDNIRSINLVSNNGFKKEGYSPRYLKINGEWRDHERWALTYEDWVISS